MAGSSPRSDGNGPKKARIEIIPLIDVVFFLLATFVLFTLSLNKSNGMTVRLPEAANSEVRDPAGTVTVSILNDDSLAWEKDPIALDEFITRLQSYKAAAGDEAAVLVNGDEGASYSAARYVFDEVRKAGIKKVKIETKVAAKGASGS